MTWEKVLEIKEIENEVIKRILENSVSGNEKKIRKKTVHEINWLKIDNFGWCSMQSEKKKSQMYFKIGKLKIEILK